MTAPDDPQVDRKHDSRVLFLASSFPPANRPGSPRTWHIATSLAQRGWSVTVVTVEPSQWVRRDPDVDEQLRAAGIRRIAVRNAFPSVTGGLLKRSRIIPSIVARGLRKLSSIFQIDPQVGWFRPVEWRCSRIDPSTVDVVLVSAPPFGLLPSARRIAERLGRPLVVDYRDVWTANPMLRRPPARRHRRADRAVIERASAVTTVSPSMAGLLRTRMGAGDKVHLIPNGYNAADLAGVRPLSYGEFAIAYAGTFYLPERTITPVFEALALLDRQQPALPMWRFHYFGPHGAHVVATARECGLNPDRVVCHGSVSRPEALAAVAGANLVTVVTTIAREGTEAERGVVTGKIFEAIGLRRPMLVIAPENSDVEGVLRISGLGRVFSGPDTGLIAQFISEVMVGSVPPAASPERYEWASIGLTLSDLLRSVARRNRV
jgi:hypothetical protein